MGKKVKFPGTCRTAPNSYIKISTGQNFLTSPRKVLKFQENLSRFSSSDNAFSDTPSLPPLPLLLSSLPPSYPPLPPPPAPSPPEFTSAIPMGTDFVFMWVEPSGSEPNFFQYTLTCDPALEGLVQPDAVVTGDTQASITGFEDGATYLCSLTAGVEGYVTAPVFLTFTVNETGMLVCSSPLASHAPGSSTPPLSPSFPLIIMMEVLNVTKLLYLA